MQTRTLRDIRVYLTLASLVTLAYAGCTAQTEVNVALTATATPVQRLTSPTPPATATPMPSAAPIATKTAVPTPALITPPPPLEQLSTQSKISPDGQWIALSKFEQPAGDLDYHISFQVVKADGSVSWTLVDEWSHGLGYTYPRLLNWSQDSQRFYFTQVDVPDGCSPPFDTHADIRYVDVNTGQVTDVLAPEGFEHAVSPDEAIMAYIAPSEPLQLALRNMQTAVEQMLPLSIQSSGSGEPEAGNIVWSPDGTALVLTIANGALCESKTPLFSLVRVDVPTLTLTTLIPSDRRLLRAQEWSVDGRILLKDWDNNSWWIDAATGQVTSAPKTPVP
ncbi:MAG TPA: hypothetical protein VJ793_07360 [Anaerolineae bacterium]|nr:hypothetical protein [Anaerolineae bacterium]